MIRNVRLLYIHNFLSDFLPQWPFLVIYFAQISGSYTAAMSVIAVRMLSASIIDLPSGVFSDRMGRRMTLACGSLCCAIAVTAYAFAHNLLLLYVGAALFGIGQCFFSGNNNAMLYESLRSVGQQDQYHHYRGKTGSMFQAAMCISALLSIWIGSFDLRVIFMVGIIPQVIAVGVSLFFEEPTFHQASKPKSFSVFKQACLKTWKNPHLLMLVTSRSINYGADEAGFDFETAFFSQFWPLWAIGLARAQGHFLAFLGYIYSGRLIERFGEPALFIARDAWWYFISVTGLALNSVISPVIMKSGSFFFGSGEVASDHLMQKEFSDEERATMGSVSSFTANIVHGLVALLVGVVSDHFGVRMAILCSATLAFMALPINLRLYRKRLAKLSGS
jgi:MFS family permease